MIRTVHTEATVSPQCNEARLSLPWKANSKFKEKPLKPENIPFYKTIFLFLLLVAAAFVLSSCEEPDVQIIVPPKILPMALPDSVGVYDLCFTDTMNGWLAVRILGHTNKYKGGIFKTSDGGLTWYASYLSLSSYAAKIQFINSHQGFATGNRGLIVSTSNGGITWNEYKNPDLFGGEDSLHYLSGLSFPNSTEGWIGSFKAGGPADCSGYGYILHTTDGGASWTINYETTDGGFYGLCMLSSGKGWAVGGGHYFDCDPFIMYTSNNGATWARQINITPGYVGVPNNVTFHDSTFGFVHGPMGTLRSTNGGQRWDTTGNGIGQSFRISICTDSIVYCLAHWPFQWAYSIYQSTDRGKNWNKQLEVTDNLRTMFFLNDSCAWAAGEISYPYGFALYHNKHNVWIKVR